MSLVAVFDPILRLAGIVRAAADAGDDGVVIAGTHRADHRAGEARADDAFEGSDLADGDLALGVHGGQAGGQGVLVGQGGAGHAGERDVVDEGGADGGDGGHAGGRRGGGEERDGLEAGFLLPGHGQAWTRGVAAALADVRAAATVG